MSGIYGLKRADRGPYVNLSLEDSLGERVREGEYSWVYLMLHVYGGKGWSGKKTGRAVVSHTRSLAVRCDELALSFRRHGHKAMGD